MERPNQKSRTRKDLLRAAARLMKDGAKPSLEEIAQEALVSRATAYRYFSGLDALLLEAALDVAVPEAADLFPEGAPQDPLARVERVGEALHEMITANETALRRMLIHTLERGLAGDTDAALPARQNRRTPLIEAALAPAGDRIDPAARKTLGAALSLILGIEAIVVFKDVLRVDEAEAHRVKTWAIRALVKAAQESP